MIKELIPHADRVLVKLLPVEEEKTEGGLIFKETGDKSYKRATVVSVGPGKFSKDGHRVLMTVKTSDVVYLGIHTGVEIGNDYLIMSEDEILGLIKHKTDQQ